MMRKTGEHCTANSLHLTCHIKRRTAQQSGMSLQTIENTREKDVTMIAPDDTEVDADDAQDEFAGEVLHILPFFFFA